MKNLFFIIAWPCLLLAQSGFAGGDEVINGGDVVICPGFGGAQVVQPLDHFEAPYWNRVLDLGPHHFSVERKVQLVLDRVARYDLRRSEQYQREVDRFFDETEWVDGPLDEIDDSLYVPHLPANCELVQAIHQRRTSRFDVSYRVSSDLWNLLDTDGRAGLILHEVVLKDAVDRGHRKSLFARLFNVYLSSKDFEIASASDYQKDLIQAQMSEFRQVLSDGAGVIRLFPDLPRPLAEAKDFCRRLSFASRLWDYHPEHWPQIKDGLVGQMIRFAMTPIWVQENDDLVNALAVSFDSEAILGFEDPGDSLPFACWDKES